ncbi:hypothetical protein Emin_1549 [Elusimicrobium minutum Pei191]|uniref:Urease accessory protein UreH-like transmembrane domain-containing protein n=1 Tax=Elusimicrobium minutum (strain Pei191) TaxID=445932 RepID=B2KEZ9_ELUMP|nr:hypothetical protein [Elusimicrobium minutum]ACC99095.1 hypothetical protein Emin_1549 [Elusimicrobium minutum Pei191]
MQSNVLIVLTAVGLGLTHTILAPNHYLPFIAIAKARNWTLPKTLFITFLCSSGHIIGSLIIAVIAVLFGVAASKIEIIDGYRANIAAWGLILFGLIYFLYGVKAARHNHSCCEHIHTKKDDIKSLTPFILFMLFLFAPCEAFIPIMMIPAIENIPMLTVAVALAFGITTMITMVVAVGLGYKGVELLPFKKWERYGHMIAGAVILICGILVEVLGHVHHHVH